MNEYKKISLRCLYLSLGSVQWNILNVFTPWNQISDVFLSIWAPLLYIGYELNKSLNLWTCMLSEVQCFPRSHGDLSHDLTLIFLLDLFHSSNSSSSDCLKFEFQFEFLGLISALVFQFEFEFKFLKLIKQHDELESCLLAGF